MTGTLKTGTGDRQAHSRQGQVTDRQTQDRDRGQKGTLKTGTGDRQAHSRQGQVTERHTQDMDR